MKKIEESFQSNQYVYVIGRSGYGKTTLAKQFASKIKEKQNHIIKWIGSENLIFSFQVIAEELGMGLDDKIKSEDLIEKVKNKLNRYTIENNLELFIFIDNLIYNEKDETLNDYQYLINNFNSNIKFLITTKNQTILDELNEHKSIKIELKIFNREDCFKFIDKNLNKIQHNNFKQEYWEKIFNLMNPLNGGNGILPIRLDKLISKINEKRTWDYKRVENYINNNEENSFELMKQENPKAFVILSYLAFLKGDSISLKLITNLFVDDTLNEKQKEIIEDELNDSLKFLENNSEIMIYDKTYSIHETTQIDVLRNIPDQLEFKNKIMKILDNLIDYDAKENNKFKLEENEEEYFNHLIKILQETNRDNLNKNHLNILKKVAGIYNNILSKYDKAKEYYILDLEISLKLLPKNDPNVGMSYNNIGKVYFHKGEYNKAIEYYNKSLNILKISLPYDHSDFARTYNSIGLVYYDNGEYDKALEYFNKSLNIQKVTLPNYHPDIARTYNNKGEVYFNKGEYEKALEYYNKSLNIRKISLHDNHPHLASSFNNIGLVYDNKGEYEKAIEYYNRSLNIRNVSLPENHPDLALSYNNLGGVYFNKGDNDKALEYFNKSLNIQKLSLPDNHPGPAGCYNNIGLVYYNKGDNDKALEYYLQSLNIRKITLHENHPDLATSYNNISLVYNDKGDYDKALNFYNKSLSIQKKSLPENHPQIAGSYHNIGLVYDNKGDYDKALEYYRKSLKIQKKSLPENHPDLARTYNSIGLVYYYKEVYSKALEYYKLSLDIRKKTLPDNHSDLASSYNNIGLVYDDEEDYEKAIEYYKKSLNIMKISLPNHPNIDILIQNINRCKKENDNKDLR
jgi:tetratricopeptide (TPR) repeat protein